MAGFGGERVEPSLVDCLVGERAGCGASAQDTMGLIGAEPAERREVDEHRQGPGLVRHASDGQERLFQVHAGNFEFARPVPGVEEDLQDAVGVG